MWEVFFMHYYLLCRSLTYAQRSVRILERAGVTGTITKMPRLPGVRGCAYGVLIDRRKKDRAVSVLSEAGLAPERIFLREADGSVREATDHDMA